MLTWMIYVVFVSILLGIAALAAERRAHLRRKSSRWYWFLAIVASLLLPTVIASVSIQLPNIFNPAVAQKIVVLREVTSTQLSPNFWLSQSVERLPAHRHFDGLIKQIWLMVSALLFCGLLASGIHLWWRKRKWSKGSLLKTSVLITEDIGPAVIGLINPQIVIPAWVIESPPEQQRAVIAHEQSHLDAGDPLLLTVAVSLLVFMPWNLPLWWQLRRLRCAIEVDCDSRVLRSGQSISSYGDTLIAVGKRQSGYIGAVAGMSESKSFLEKRIKIMVTKPKKWWRFSAAVFGVASLAFAAVAAQVSPPNAKGAVQKQEILLPASTLAKYTGSYRFLDVATMTISSEGSRIFSQLSGQPVIEIFALSATEFFPKVVDAKLVFTVNEKGEATALTLHQNGAEINAPRIDAASAEKIAGALKNRIANQQPNSGSEAAMRGLIAGLASGNPDYSTMDAGLAQATREQLPQLQASIQALGKVKAVTFRSVDIQGWDVYFVSHDKGNAEWKIQLSESGLITGAWVVPSPQ